MSKRTFNTADAIIAVVAFISILCLVMRITHTGSGNYLKEEDYKITFTAAAVTEEETAKLKVGDKFRTEDGTAFGTLTEGYRIDNTDEGKTVVTAAVICRGTVTETGLFTCGEIRRAGDKLTVTSGDLKLEITVVSFEKAE